MSKALDEVEQITNIAIKTTAFLILLAMLAAGILPPDMIDEQLDKIMKWHENRS